MTSRGSRFVFLQANMPWLYSAVAMWIINVGVVFYLRQHVIALYSGSNFSPWMQGVGWLVFPLAMTAFLVLVGPIFCRIQMRQAKWQPHFRLVLMMSIGLGVIFFVACFVQLVVDIGHS